MAVNNGAMVGVLRFDADPEIDRTWLYSPFASDEGWQETVDQLWNLINPLIPRSVREVEIYCNASNAHVIGFANERGVPMYKDAVILQIDRGRALDRPEPEGVTLIASEQRAAFINLHETTFPNTYYTGEQILERVYESPDRRVFVTVEAFPELSDATVEFFKVSPDARGKGVGTRLLRAALQWIFTYPTIDVLSLTTETDNDVALRLYQRAGFQLVHEMRSFRARI